MKFETKYARLIEDVIEELGGFDLIVNEAAEINRKPSFYVNKHKHEYVRTIQDVTRHFSTQPNARVLEIGAFFGTVSIALAKLGFNVTASDIPEYMSLQEHKDRFFRYDIETVSIRLQDFVLPFEDGTFDAIIMCEVLEHLNFNPLPLLKQCNRILSDGGLLYLSLPNQAKIGNRLSLLRGRSIGVPVDSFFKQLDPTDAEIANGHWREYTTEDIKKMLSRLGFSIIQQYYFSLGECQNEKSLRKRLGRFFYKTFPQFKENQTTLAVKECNTDLEFYIPETVHPSLRKL